MKLKKFLRSFFKAINIFAIGLVLVFGSPIFIPVVGVFLLGNYIERKYGQFKYWLYTDDE